MGWVFAPATAARPSPDNPGLIGLRDLSGYNWDPISRKGGGTFVWHPSGEKERAMEQLSGGGNDSVPFPRPCLYYFPPAKTNKSLE